LPEEMMLPLFRLTAEVPDAIVPARELLEVGRELRAMDEVRLNPVRCLVGMPVASIGSPSLVASREMSPHAISATAGTDRG
jgi:hypothetical protein